MKHLIPQSLKNIYHLGWAILANVYFGFPSHRIKVIGITGTNGKTTTTQMITKILDKSGFRVAMSSTINFKMGKQEWVNATKFTTLSAWQVQKFIARAVREKCDYIVLEISSHSLDQRRVWGIAYDVAVITNVTREHLDYHKTMPEYRRAKMRLFETLASRGKPWTKKVSVVNWDMDSPEEYLHYRADLKYCYSTDNKNDNTVVQGELNKIMAKDIDLRLDGTGFIVDGQRFDLHLVGLFNVENALAAICVGLSQGIELSMIAKALGEIEKVPGRMDYVANDRGLNIIIDYALTPDSMEKLGQLIQSLKGAEKSKKLYWVFGSCGDRDRGKRPIMGRIVAEYADYAIVTNEDPYTEDPQRIIDEVYAGVCEVKQDQADCWQIMDRKEAIKKALSMAQPGDIILVTGKGAEEIMAIGDQRIPWNDRNVIEELLGQLIRK